MNSEINMLLKDLDNWKIKKSREQWNKCMGETDILHDDNNLKLDVFYFSQIFKKSLVSLIANNATFNDYWSKLVFSFFLIR